MDRLGVAVSAALLIITSFVPAYALADEPPANPPADNSAAPNPTDGIATIDDETNARVESVIAAARAYIGTPYRVGTEGPATTDCSGLVFRAFANAGELGQVGGARLRAAGYMRWFAARQLLTTNPEEAQRGDLVIYGGGEHIGIYLGEGRVISALVTGVTVHTLNGISIPATGFLAVDWTGKRGPFKPVVLPSGSDVAEAPAALVPAAAWSPETPAEDVAAGPVAAGEERVDLRTAYTRTYQDGTGQLTTELFSRPIYYQPADSADWLPIDLRFHEPSKNSPDGTAAVADTAPVSLTLGDGGSMTLATGDLSVGLSTGASSETPVTPELSADGRYADYRDLVAQGLSLRAFPRSDGLRSFLVLSKEPASREITFSVEPSGVTLAAEVDGSITLRDANDAVVGRIPRPLLIDSTDTEGDGGAVKANAVSLELNTTEQGATTLTLKVDKAALDETVYPAYVDLSLVDFPNSAAAAFHTFASSAHADSNFANYQRPESPGYAELWHGRRPERRDDNEAYLRFPGLADLLGGASVTSASLEVFPYWQGGDAEAASATWLGRVTADWDPQSLTWNTRPTNTEEDESYDTLQGQWSGMDVSAYVADVVAGTSPDYGLVLHATEAGRGHWKRFVAESDLGAGALEPRLVVHWAGLKPQAAASTDVIASSAVLAWRSPGLAPAPTRVQLQLSLDGFQTFASEAKLKKSAAAAGSVVVTTFDLDPGTYSWRVRAQYGDSHSWSDWSNSGTFVVVGPVSSPVVL